MSLARLASFVHKWLALLVGIQIVFWVVSGLFFTIFPIQQIRSENLIRPSQAQTLDTATLASLASLRGDQNALPTKLTIERRPIGQVVVAEFTDAPPILFEATTLQRLSPLSAEQANAVARAHVTLTSEPTGATLVTEETAEYRGTLPAWRVQFPDGRLSVYVAQNTGAVTARRSDLWRLYDTLWALHIMDWQNHEDFNHPLIIIVTVITLFSVIAGIVLIPHRIRFRSRPKAQRETSR
ncbi:MAG: PepSY domain-containing protein [Hyphomonadaceae bacterium]|nr:PepSY domain-containing protein [Hyphomonadaceae bacterium]